jgi:hypothetical protein
METFGIISSYTELKSFTLLLKSDKLLAIAKDKYYEAMMDNIFTHHLSELPY